jgi:hypothetical protein
MTNILTFPVPGVGRIPKPFNYRPGDSYSYLSFELEGEPPLGFPITTVFTIKEGEICDGVLHALYTPRGAIIATIDLLGNDIAQVLSLHPGYKSRDYRLGELNVIGVVEELRPKGWHGPRLVLNPTEAAESSISRTIYNVSG